MSRSVVLGLLVLAFASLAGERDSAQASVQGSAASAGLAAADSQTFADVPPSHPYYAEIEWLYQNGYTAGCSTNPLMYCPEATMNRAESAVFVERGIHSASYDPPAPISQVFADVGVDSWAAKWVNALWNDQYTAGCGTNPLTYCPWQGHTRAEGSVFYLRMLHGANYEPAHPAQQTFVDVPLEAWYAKWVQAAYDGGLITSCQSSPEMKFCPEDPLSRGLAAYMMFQAKSVTGTTYYVSPSGNDAFPGTEVQPWRTIQKAALTLSAGDTAIVRAGTYTGNVTFGRWGTANSRIHFRGESGTRLSGNLTVNGSYVSVSSFEITGVDPGSDAETPCIQINANYVEVSGNRIDHCFGPGVSLEPASGHNVVQNNRITDGVGNGIRLDGQYNVVEDNYIGRTRNYYREGSSYRGDSNGMNFFGAHHIVRNNTIEDLNHRYTKYYPTSTCNDTTAQTDASCWPHIDCFQTYRDTNDIVFEGNTCRLPRSYLPSGVPLDRLMIKFVMMERSTTDPVSNIVFRNNSFISESANSWTPIQIGNEGCQATRPIQTISVYHNTFVKTTGPGSMALLLRCITDIDVKNNLFIDFGSASYSYIHQDRDISGMTVDHNAVYKTNGQEPAGGPYPGDNIPATWMRDPRIISLVEEDIHLDSNSPLIDAGVTIASVASDIDGEARPQGSGYDMGADEYTGTSPNPPTKTVCSSGCMYATIQSAVNVAVAGDIVEIHAGTYPEAITINRSGTEAGWITPRARSGDAVWLDGSSLANTASNIDLGSYGYWRIVGLKGRYAGASNSPSGTDVVDGIRIGQGGHDILIDGVEIQAPSGDGIDVRGANYNIRILNSEIYDMRIDAPSWGGDGHGIHVVQARGVPASHDILVVNNYVHDSHGKACLALADYSALDAPHPTSIIFEYNRVKDCTNGIKVNADGVFRYNTVIDSGKYSSGIEKPDCGFQAFTHDAENNVRNAQIYNNTVVGFNNSYGFDMAEGGSQPTQNYSVFQNNIGYNPKVVYVDSSNTTFGNDGNNLFYGQGNTAFSGYVPPVSTIFSDPLFANAAVLDYTLTSMSPAINAGVIVYSEQPFNGNSPDIGAHESVPSGSVGLPAAPQNLRMR